jgi:hypothetical protein
MLCEYAAKMQPVLWLGHAEDLRHGGSQRLRVPRGARHLVCVSSANLCCSNAALKAFTWRMQLTCGMVDYGWGRSCGCHTVTTFSLHQFR